MKASELIKLLESLDPDTEVTVQTCNYDGAHDRYEDQEPKLIHNIEFAILTGKYDLYAQLNAAENLSGHPQALRLLQQSNTIVEVK